MMKNALANAAVPRRAYVITQCNNLDVYILHAVVVNIFLYTAGRWLQVNLSVYSI